MDISEIEHISYWRTLRVVWGHLSSRRRWQLGLLGVLTILATFADLVSIAAILPFLATLASPEKLFATPEIRPLIDLLGYSRPEDLLWPITAFFVAAAGLSGVLRLAINWAQARLSHAIGIDLAVEIFERTIHQPYAAHAANNTSRALAVITGKSLKLVTGIILPTLSILGGVALFLAVAIALAALAPQLAAMLIGGFAAIYFGVAFILRARLRANGGIIAREMSRTLQILQEGLGSIRDILLDGSQTVHVRRLAASIGPMRRATANNTFLSSAPRFVIETLGMIILAVVAFTIANGPGGIESALPVLGALALGAQRLLPVAQQAYSGWTLIRSASPATSECLKYLALPRPDPGTESLAALPFKHEIRFENVGFSYASEGPPALQDVAFSIPRGARLGIIGPTGSGKSTLADILMGLLPPGSGKLTVDGHEIDDITRQAWQKHIAHVPQAIFLADTSLAANIAFGVPPEKIDRDLLHEAIARAQLAETVERLPEGIETRVGERGIRLSGGQRQRIGIARALYRKADVIVFDEATSALDNETEQKVISAIEGLDRDLTLVMIAHRLSTLSNCDQIVRIENGRLTRIGNSAEVLSKALPR